MKRREGREARRKVYNEEEKETGRNALFQPMLLSRQARIKQIQRRGIGESTLNSKYNKLQGRKPAKVYQV